LAAPALTEQVIDQVISQVIDPLADQIVGVDLLRGALCRNDLYRPLQ
jgi:hypothetical protein